MKKTQQHRIIATSLLSALLALSPAVFAEDTTSRDVRQGNITGSNSGDSSNAPVSKRWKAPQRHNAWTIPALSQPWGRPKHSTHWTIPRSADDILKATE